MKTIKLTQLSSRVRNCILLEIKERPRAVFFAREELANSDKGGAKLFTEAEAAKELARLQKWPGSRFQIVVLRLGETTEFDRTD